MNVPAEGQVLAFPGFFLDVRQRVLVGPGGAAVTISSRAFETLLYLVEHPDELIEKQRLMKAVWPNSIVEENNLNQHISMLRKLLGEAPGEHRFIVTVPGRGFRFVQPVQRLNALPAPEAQSAPAEPVPAPGPKARRGSLPWIAAAAIALVLAFGFSAFTGFVLQPHKEDAQAAGARAVPSLAVLPFADVSPNRDQAYFTDGLSEEVLNTLGRLPGLRVIGRTSSFSFKDRNEDVREIGAALGVGHVLEGSVRREADQLRITVQLVNANSGSQRWAATYDRRLGDVFAVQREIAQAVAASLQLELEPAAATGPGGGTKNLEAYEAYLSARAIVNERGSVGSRQAIDELERAVRLDPEFALAWATLAEIYPYAVDFPPADALPLSRVELQQRAARAALRAFELAPNTPQALRSAGSVSMQNRDWREADRRLRKAVELAGPFDFDSNLSYGLFLMNVGRLEQATTHLQRAVRAEPLLIRPASVLGAIWSMRGDFDRAAAQLEAGKKLQGDPMMIRNSLTTLYLARRDLPALRVVLAQNPGPLGDRLLPLLEDPAAALKVLRSSGEMDVSGDVNNFALMHWAAFFGDYTLSLEAMHAIGPTQNVFVIWQPTLRKVRELPGFRDVVREFGLLDYWRASGQWGEFCSPAGTDDFSCR